MKARRGRRVDATGRSVGDGQHVRLYRYELESPAYRSLSLGARALLVELKALYNGSNNGELFMSARTAAERLSGAGKRYSKSFAALRLRELQERGFIRPKGAKGAFSVKCLVGEGRATSWILTEHPHGNALPTKDFMRWQPAEIQNAVHPRGRTVHPRGRSATKEQETPKSVHPRGRFRPQVVHSRSTPVDTVSLPREVA